MFTSLFPCLGQKCALRLTTTICGPTSTCQSTRLPVRHFARLGKRQPNGNHSTASNKPLPPSIALDLCAHIVAPQIQQSIPECREFLLENPKHVQEFEKDMMMKTGMTVVYSDNEVSVIDTIPDFEKRYKRARVKRLERTLHFNDTLDFIQTSVNVNARTKAIHHDQPLNLETANHIIALSLSIVLHFANQAEPASPTSHLNAGVKRCAVLGAGGCIFPIILSSVLPPSADIHAIELSDSVIHAALKYFSVAPYVSNITDYPNSEGAVELESGRVDNKFQLHSGCGVDWLSKEVENNKEANLDMIFIDIFDGDMVDNSEEKNSKQGKRITSDMISNVTMDSEAKDVDDSGEDDQSHQNNGETDFSFCPKDSELFIPSKNILNRDNLRLFAKALSDKGGVLAINTVGNLDAIENAAKWMGAVLNKDPVHNFHVGFMKVPIVLHDEDEDGEKGSAEAAGGGGGGGGGGRGEGRHSSEEGEEEAGSRGAFVRRDNIVLFIVKNPTAPNISSDVLKTNLLKYLALSEEEGRPKSSIPLPFANEKLEPFISKWISMYENVDSSGKFEE
jgi:hypothetical protein